MRYRLHAQWKAFRSHLQTLKYGTIALLTLCLCLFASPGLATHPSVDRTPQISLEHPQLLQTLEQQARALYEAGRFSEAAIVLQQAIDGYQHQGDSLRQALLLSNLALTYHQLGNWNEANAAITTSLALLQRESSTPAHRSAQAQAFDIQGQLQLAQGQAEQAIAAWQQAAQRYEQLNNTDRLIRNQINQSRALQALGLYRQAMTRLNQLAQTLQAQPDSLTKAAGLRSLGDALRVAGNLDQSRQRLEESLTIAQRLQVANQDIGADIAETIALIQLSLGNTARAQQYWTDALNFYQQAAYTGSDPTQLQSNLNQLSLLVEQQRAEAETLLPQIREQLNNQPTNRTTLYAQINLAQSLIHQAPQEQPSAFTEAIEWLSITVQQAEAIGDWRTTSYALGLLGGVNEIKQQWSEAEMLTRRALQLAQSINAPDITYLWQWQLGRILKAQADQGIDPVENIAEAIRIYDEALNTLQSLRLDLASINPDEQFSFRESVEPAYRQFIELLLQTGGTLTEPSQDNLVKARRTLESLQAVELQNFFREACIDVPILLDRIVEQTSTLTSDQTELRTAIIYPIILPDRLEIILKLPNQDDLLHYATAVPQRQVEATLEALRYQMIQPETFTAFQRTSQQVYDWLIHPTVGELMQNQISILVFVLDGYLKNIPMAALYDGTQYLVEQYSIALTPGLEILEPQPLERQRVSFLFAGLSEAVENFSPLTAVEQERDGILARIPNAVVLMNQDFTAEALQTQIERVPFQIVHLATHGQFSSDRTQTFIQTLNRPIPVDELDRVLRTRDQTRPTPIELLTLSACQTAEGDERAALGLAGVAVRAGARSTLASLWSIDDESGASLMIEFYRQLIDYPSLTKSQALQKAQLALLNHPNYRHPSYWAPYVLLGNWL